MSNPSMVTKKKKTFEEMMEEFKYDLLKHYDISRGGAPAAFDHRVMMQNKYRELLVEAGYKQMETYEQKLKRLISAYYTWDVLKQYKPVFLPEGTRVFVIPLRSTDWQRYLISEVEDTPGTITQKWRVVSEKQVYLNATVVDTGEKFYYWCYDDAAGEKRVALAL